jgi:hypothetical protein
MMLTSCKSHVPQGPSYASGNPYQPYSYDPVGTPAKSRAKPKGSFWQRLTGSSSKSGSTYQSTPVVSSRKPGSSWLYSDRKPFHSRSLPKR